MANEVRLIDANAFLDRIKERHDDIMQDPIVDKATKWRESVCFGGVVNVLVKMPTVDAVEVVHGRWMDNIDENGYLCNAWRKCSACGGLNFSKRPPYCPNCGAKMDGDGNV